ncbi:MAG: Two-component system, OmpR family, sensor histidine kinase VicK [Parcubacteria group bacterium]|nr:Two-component system, OmpR family, sensor histidine kinase VicK [Parcubacteria group bacterium]
MSTRKLLFLLFGGALLLVTLFVAAILSIAWTILSPHLPSEISLGGVLFPGYIPLVVIGVLVFLIIGLTLVFLYLLIDRMLIEPVKDITTAMQEFSEHNERVPLPAFTNTTLEVRTLSTVFLQFIDSVEKVHARDMEVSRVKSDFISTAAHQLRTPMTGIRWALEALQASALTPDQKVLIESAVGKSHDLVSIVGTLLDISSIESGKYKYKFEPVDMNQMVEEMARDFAPLAQTRQISLYYAKGDVAYPAAKADRERIKWVLNNLVENAIRYTPPGGSVQLSMDGGVGRIFVRVRDTGIGIQPGDRSSIFERFYRAQNAVQKENSGNGLGLYIARTIATDHGGDLNFEPNKDGPGTTFTFSLPVAV